MKPIIKTSLIVILQFWTAIYLPSCKKDASPPVVKTTIVSEATKTSVTIEGNVTNDGGAEIIEIGICWSTSLNPTVSSNKASNGKGFESFSTIITGLTPQTRYYVRAYAINSAGISYGNQVSFETTPFNEGSTIPILVTADVTSIASTSAMTGGTITSDGGEDITDKGITWSTVPDWYMYDDGIYSINMGPGSGSFASNMSGLTPGTTYFVKAFATNAVGMAFGPTIRFTTAEEPVGRGTRKANFPGGPRYLAAGFSVGTKAYLGLGFDDGDNYQSDFWEWDQAANVWTMKADFPGTYHPSFICFTIGTKGYIHTGGSYYTNGVLIPNEFWEYDPATDTWTQKATIPVTPGRSGAVGFSIGNKGYIGLGAKTEGLSDSYYRDFWEWDQETNVWRQKSDFEGNIRGSAVGFSIGKKGYIGTGHIGNNNYSREFWEWDQETNKWTRKADFGGSARFAAVGFSIGNKAYIGTGVGGSLYKNDLWEWDQATNEWTLKADFGGSPRISAVGFSIGNRGYIATGLSDGYGNEYAFRDLWEYDPDLK